MANVRHDDRQRGWCHAIDSLRFSQGFRGTNPELLLDFIGQSGDAGEVEIIRDRPLLLAPYLDGIRSLPVEIDGIFRFSFKTFCGFWIDRSKLGPKRHERFYAFILDRKQIEI